MKAHLVASDVTAERLEPIRVVLEFVLLPDDLTVMASPQAASALPEPVRAALAEWVAS